MKEKEFWEKFRPMFQLHTKYCERIENRVNQGTPDVFCLDKNSEAVWIELKSVKKFGDKPEFQPQQPIWHKKYAAAGGRSYVLVHCGDRIYAHPALAIDEMLKKDFSPLPDLVADVKNKKCVNLLFLKLFGG